jgi:multidrug efflux pump subunit AcrB
MENKNKITEKLKEFKLSSFAVDNSTSFFLLAFMILLFGLRSYNSMPKEQYPDASLPTVYINTPYFGNSATEIENLVTRPIEEELEATVGIKNVTSTSIQDFSVIIAEFEADLEMESVVRKVKDAVDKAKDELPDDLTEEPNVLEVNFSELPIMVVNISGNYGNDELREYGEFLQDKIESLKAISSAKMKGVLDKEIHVDIDLLKMQSLKVSFQDVENAIASENVTMSGGEVNSGEFKRAVRVIGQFKDVEELGNMIVKSERQRAIYLKDIAKVTNGYKDRSSYARSDGYPVVSLDIIKRRGENLISAADDINRVISEAKEDLPKDLKISLFNDTSIYTKNEVNNLENSIISGVILVVLVLLFFLGLRNASFVGIAIPLSMLMGIMWLYLSGTTINIVVLFALILALGMLVDNAIVVVENIYRYMQNGYSRVEAAKFGTGEVALPIITSTITTLAAFLPLAFWPGLMGKFMQYMPITLIVVLTSSLLVALVITPVISATFMKVDEKSDDLAVRKRKRKNVITASIIMAFIGVISYVTGIKSLGHLMGFGIILTLLNFFVFRPLAFSFQEKILPKLERWYDHFIRWALKGKIPIAVFLGTFLLMFAAITLLVIKSPKVIFFPEPDPMYINAFVELPLGKDIEATNAIVKDIEKRIEKVLGGKEHIVEAVLTQIGEETNDPNTPPEPGVTPHKARITISFVKSSERGGISTKEILNQLREEVSSYAGVEVVISQNANGPPAGKPINLEIRTEDLDQLLIESDKIKQYLISLNISGIEELKKDMGVGKPELLVRIDRDAARKYEVSTYAIASALRTSIFGKEVSKFKDGEDDYPIVVRLSDKYRNDVKSIMDQKITFRNPANGQIVQVPVSAVADFEYSSTYNSIKRKDSDRVVTIYSNVLDGYNANEIVAQLKDEMSKYDLPEGFSFEFTGEQQQQAEDMAFLGNAFLVAVFTIFIILVAQFNSVISPFIIILSVLFSTIGVFLGYAITGKDISVIFSGVGIISLAGIVVNNAIVLVDYVNLIMSRKAKEKGLSSVRELSYNEIKESLIEGGATRLRPVLLTAITTVLGLVPLAIGFNFNFFTLVTDLDPQIFIGGDNTAMWGPLAWTVIYGLTFATFLTLVVVPVMYWLFIRLRLWISGVSKKLATV